MLSGMDRATVIVHGSPSAGELTALLGIDKAWYIGHRGLEIKDPQGKEIKYYGPEDLRLMDTLSEELVRQTDHLAGIQITRSGPSVRLDYRKVDPSRIPDLLESFRSVVSPFNPMLTLEHGPQSVDARIRCACDEGTALRYVHRRLLPGTLFFYFGENSAVHDGLRQLRPPGVIVNIGGRNPGTADYVIPEPEDVVDILEWLREDWRTALQKPI